MREMQSRTFGARRSIHLHFRMYVLRGLREGDESSLPQLRRRTSPPSARQSGILNGGAQAPRVLSLAPRRRLLRMSHYCDFKKIRARAALRPLARHNSSASCLYSEVYLALPRAGLVNCIFMWASFRVFDP